MKRTICFIYLIFVCYYSSNSQDIFIKDYLLNRKIKLEAVTPTITDKDSTSIILWKSLSKQLIKSDSANRADTAHIQTKISFINDSTNKSKVKIFSAQKIMKNDVNTRITNRKRLNRWIKK